MKTIATLILAFLTACGGGEEPLDTHPATIGTPDCGGGVTCR